MVEHVGVLPGASTAMKMRDSDGRLWAVKVVNNAYGNGRAIFAEQVVPLLGTLLKAPVPDVAIAELSSELITAAGLSVNGATVPSGLHHASMWADGFGDRDSIQHVDQNKSALAAASVLYAWTRASDHQLIYSNATPTRVLSVDHGAFFADSGNWDASTLNTFPDPAGYDTFFDPAGLNDIDRSDALDALERVTPESVAIAVATPPEGWSVTSHDRLALLRFLWERRQRVLAMSGRV